MRTVAEPTRARRSNLVIVQGAELERLLEELDILPPRARADIAWRAPARAG